jgi:hypothetical protein
MEKSEHSENSAQCDSGNANVCNDIALIVVRYAFIVVSNKIPYGHLHNVIYKKHQICDYKKQTVRFKITV